MTPLLFKNARIFDGTNADCAEGMSLRISDGLIQEISPKRIAAKAARVIDVGGRTLMPGLIDAHMHAYCSAVSMQKVEAMGEPYRTAHAVRMLWHALVPPFRGAALDDDVSALDQPEVAQAIHERAGKAMIGQLGDGYVVENERDPRQLLSALRIGAR